MVLSIFSMIFLNVCICIAFVSGEECTLLAPALWSPCLHLSVGADAQQTSLSHPKKSAIRLVRSLGDLDTSIGSTGGDGGQTR